MNNPTTEQQKNAIWKKTPEEPGLYLVWERGRGLDILYWCGEDDPLFAIYTDKAFYHGPLPKLPLSV